MKWKNRGHEFDHMYQEISEKKAFIYLELETMVNSFYMYLKRKFQLRRLL